MEQKLNTYKVEGISLIKWYRMHPGKCVRFVNKFMNKIDI